MKLQEIQKNLKAPKDLYNSFGKYKYRSAEGILEAVKPMLGDSTLTLTDEIVQVGDRIYVKATAIFEEGSALNYKVHEVSAYAREPFDKKGMDDSQITGSASSYARKYALNGLFLIDDNKDPDETNDYEKKELERGTELWDKVEKAIRDGKRKVDDALKVYKINEKDEAYLRGL